MRLRWVEDSGTRNSAWSGPFSQPMMRNIPAVRLEDRLTGLTDSGAGKFRMRQG